MFLKSLPKNFLTASCIAGILVVPPTRIISSISPRVRFAFFIAVIQGSIVLLTKESTNCSNLDFDNVENFLLNRNISPPYTSQFYVPREQEDGSNPQRL